MDMNILSVITLKEKLI